MNLHGKVTTRLDSRNSRSKLSELEASLSVLECNHHQVQIVAMLYGTCKGTLEMHIYPPIYALVCMSDPKKKKNKKTYSHRKIVIHINNAWKETHNSKNY